MKANRELFPDHHLSSIHESGGCWFSLSGPYLLIFEELMVMPFIEFWGVKTLFWDLDVEFERGAKMDHSCELMNPIRFADWCKRICERIRWS
jgi:hypothetical protein